MHVVVNQRGMSYFFLNHLDIFYERNRELKYKQYTVGAVRFAYVDNVFVHLTLSRPQCEHILRSCAEERDWDGMNRCCLCSLLLFSQG